MLLTKKQSSKKFFLRIHITLRSPSVSVELIDSASFNFEFRLHCRTRSFILYAVGGDEERKFWVDDIQHSIKGTHADELKGKGKDAKGLESPRDKELESPKTERDPNKEKKQDPPKSDKPKKTISTTLAAKKASSSSRNRAASEANQERTGFTDPARNRSATELAPLSGSATDRTRRPKKPTELSSPDVTRSSPGLISGQSPIVNAQPLEGNVANAIFIYANPMVTNNPFLDVPEVNQNPFATTTFAKTANPYASNPAFATAPVFSNPRMTLDPSILANMTSGGSAFASPSPFGTNSNPFAQQPAFGNPPQSTFGQYGGQQVNPFATNPALSGPPNPFATTPSPFTGNNQVVPVNPFASNATSNPYSAGSPIQSNPFATAPAPSTGNHFF